MKKGYFTGPVMIILALIIFFVAVALFLNADLLESIKNKPTPSSQSALQAQPSPTPSASREPNSSTETANWETYSNKEIGIKFQYPDLAEVETLDQCLTPNCLGKGMRLFYYSGKVSRSEAFSTHLTEGLLLDISQVKNDNNSLKDFADERTSKPGYGVSERKDFNQIKLDGADGYKATFDSFFEWLSNEGSKTSSGTYEAIYVNSKNRTYFISATYTGKDVTNYKNIYDQILSTFKFLN